VSKSKSPNAKNTSPQCTQGAVAAGTFASIASTFKNGNGICDEPGGCFGRCGRDCEGQPWLGNFQTQQCWAHDLCVCMWSDGDCFFFSGSNPPNGYCPGCGDLFDAAMSWFGGLFDWLTDWFAAWSFGVMDTLVNWP
jgi:hypothetical protein